MSSSENRKKAYNIVSITLAILSFIITIVLYVISIKDKEIKYIVDDKGSLVYNGCSVSKRLKLFENDSLLINGNVYLVNGKLWNSGDISILPTDVRKPLTIKINFPNRIIDYSIIYQNDSTIADFAINMQSDSSLTVNWKYFDPDYGFIFKILYIGNESPNLSIQGNIQDVKDIQKYELKKDRSLKDKLAYILYPICLIIIMIIFIYKSKKYGFPIWFHVANLVYDVFLLIFNVWLYFFYNGGIPF